MWIPVDCVRTAVFIYLNLYTHPFNVHRRSSAITICIISADPEQGRTMHQIARPQLPVSIELELVGVVPPEKIHAGLAPFSQVPAKATCSSL